MNHQAMKSLHLQRTTQQRTRRLLMRKLTGWNPIWESLAKQVGDIFIPLSLRREP